MPHQRQPGPSFPGDPTPGEEYVLTEAETLSGVAIDATGTTDIGTPDGFRGEVVSVAVDADAADFNFNVNADGSALFSSNQSPSGTSEETFTPDQNENFEGDAPDLVFDVTAASATAGATATVTVTVRIEEG